MQGQVVLAIRTCLSQPFAIGHLQGPTGDLISQVSVVEALPISQGQTYAEHLPLAVKTHSCWEGEYPGKENLGRAPRLSTTCGIKGDKSYFYDIVLEHL